MHPSIIARRKAMAANRITERVNALAERTKMDPSLLEAFNISTRDPQAADMLRLEAVANLLAHIAEEWAVVEVQPDTAVGEFHQEPDVPDIETAPLPETEEITEAPKRKTTRKPTTENLSKRRSARK